MSQKKVMVTGTQVPEEELCEERQNGFWKHKSLIILNDIEVAIRKLDNISFILFYCLRLISL